MPLVLASQSSIRAALLTRAGLSFDVVAARIDEQSVTASLELEQATPRNVADTLAEMKARKVSDKVGDAMVIGCDQILDLNGSCLSKPITPEHAREQLDLMQGARHTLLSAAVIIENGQPVWRHVGVVRLHMRPLSSSFIHEYVNRNWDSIRHAVGCYKLEEEGVRLFSSIDGSYFNVLGLPLIELLNFLTVRGILET